MTRVERVALDLDKLALLIGDNADAKRIVLMAEFLSAELNDEQIAFSCNEVLKRETRIPPPAKFIEYAKGSSLDRAEAALKTVFRAINKFSDMDGAAARAWINDESAWSVVASYGGWYSLVTDPNFNRQVFHAQFLKSYQSHDISFKRPKQEFNELSGGKRQIETEDQRLNRIDRQKENMIEILASLSEKRQLP